MSTAVTSVPGGDSAAAGGAPVGTPATGEGQVASAVPGNAPEGGGDALAGVSGQGGELSSAAPSLFRFGGRDWQSLKHAEDAIKAQIGRTPEIQRQNAGYQKQITEMQAEMQALRRMAMSGTPQGPGPGGPQGRQGQGGPRSLVQELEATGELGYIQHIAQDPDIGIPGAVVAMGEALEKRMESRVERMLSEHVAPLAQQFQMQQGLAQFFGGAKPIIAQFPELADDNQAPEAIEAREQVLQVLQTLPPEWLAQHPEAIGMATLWVRHENGTPVFAQQPGMSGSPSARASAALEAASAASTSIPLDGSGVPRAAAGGRESQMDRMRRENKASSNIVRSAGGKPLFPE